ncbi:MAG: hypothetical protein ONB17_09690 [candidate division KSB1 bacterium]|nr:hypothetical protein [candidate division KSB1 bacterium]MDZ7378489.1 hypothetical protein [candidate division KSB1 bacterium]
MRRQLLRVGLVALMLSLWATSALPQKDYNGPPLFIDVNAIKLDMKKLNGEGQFTTQYSWMLTGTGPEKTEIFFYPQDQWHSQLLYQIFNPICLDDSGCVDQKGNRKIIPTPFVSNGVNDWSMEIRRYRPPYVTVDGVPLYREYRWQVDPKLKPDIAAIWEDILPFWGIRTHVEVYAFSNPNHQDYIIWKGTYKFTGETRRPIENPGPEDFFPDQTIRLWWPVAFSFGPSKAGEYEVFGHFAYEGEDDLDSWFARKSQLVTGRPRDTLKVAYYWDSTLGGSAAYPNGSRDHTGDPDRTTGHLISPQVPGYALLYACSSPTDPADDPGQPYAMPHAGIVKDLWGRRDFGLRDTYIGHDSRGKFPKDIITEGWATSPEKGPMRFVTVGPYRLTKNAAIGRYDSITVVYAIGVGSLSWDMADSIGKAWFAGQISDQEKNTWVLSGRDSLFKVLDRAYWAWSRGLDIPDPPPPPDLEVISDADRVVVRWSYPDPSYFKDPDTGVDDWYAWRVYRKKGASYVGDPQDAYSGERWQLIFETTNRNQTTFVDTAVTRGVSYYYAVTAVDDGTQNRDGLFPGQKLESSRFANRSAMPAIPFKAGLATTQRVRVVPNPASIRAGGLGFPGAPDRILFTQLPYKCKLRVFTETGDQIISIDHFGTDQEVWDQRTDANQYVTSGIYVLAVTEAEDVDGHALPDQFVKFVLVR